MSPYEQISDFYESGFKRLGFSQAGTLRISPDVLKFNKTARFDNPVEDGLGLHTSS